MVQYFSHMSKTNIETILNDSFKPTFLKVIDDSAKHAGHAQKGQGGHYIVEITSAAFDGKKLIDCHRLIYAALEPIKRSIHALAIKVVRNA